MARKRSIAAALRPTADVVGDQPADAPPATVELAETAPEPPKPARRRPARPLASVPASAPTEAPEDAPKGARKPGPTLLVPASTQEAERVGLYLHPDDFRELNMARLDDKADANARIRAMIALWRHNERFRAAVDKLARTQPRGGGRR